MSKISEALKKLFKEHRVIFWYDDESNMSAVFDALELGAVEKVKVENNHFQVKHRVLKSESKRKFLLYFDGEKPRHDENWLLDIELSNYIFYTDQEALFLQEMGLGYHLKEMVKQHIEFFKNAKNRTKFKKLATNEDSFLESQEKMLTVLFEETQVNLNRCLYTHAAAFIKDDEVDKYADYLNKYCLHDVYWKWVENRYHYHSESPTIYDFIMEVFSSNFALTKGSVSNESKILLSIWKDTISYVEDFKKIAQKISLDLGIKEKLEEAKVSEIIQDDLFELTDLKIITTLIDLILHDGISSDNIESTVKQRQNKFWFKFSETYKLSAYYACVLYAMKLIHAVKSVQEGAYATLKTGVQAYTSNLFFIDQYYRKFLLNYKKTNKTGAIVSLYEKIEKVYSNDWLLSYNDRWQQLIDAEEEWPIKGLNAQADFFEKSVKPIVQGKKQRLFVIISDALRYECGEELSHLLNQRDKVEAKLDYMISNLPSYTQLGMASLLPHKELSIQENKDIVIVDGIPSNGTPNRTKILATNAGVRSIAMRAEELMNKTPIEEGRAFFKQYDLIYIYHNKIDKEGDDKTTEGGVFDAVEQEFEYLDKLTRRIFSLNGTNILITADHGFIYQDKKLDDREFSVSNYTGALWKENRRFVIGKNLASESNNAKIFKGEAIGLTKDVEILLAKSINRFRIKGAGSRFIHGGSTLQEVVVPMIKLSKKTSNVSTKLVDIDIIYTTNKITTNILAVSFIQSNLVSDNILERRIRVGIYAVVDDKRELLSDHFSYVFDIREGAERQREVKHRFQLSAKASTKYKNQAVQLILEEPIPNSTKYKLYKEFPYTLNISFTNDFDF